MACRLAVLRRCCEAAAADLLRTPPFLPISCCEKPNRPVDNLEPRGLLGPSLWKMFYLLVVPAHNNAVLKNNNAVLKKPNPAKKTSLLHPKKVYRSLQEAALVIQEVLSTRCREEAREMRNKLGVRRRLCSPHIPRCVITRIFLAQNVAACRRTHGRCAR